MQEAASPASSRAGGRAMPRHPIESEPRRVGTPRPEGKQQRTVDMDEQSQRDKDFDPDLQAEVAPEQNSESDKQMRSWADEDKKDDLPNVL
jgi:hypothetical protein